MSAEPHRRIIALIIWAAYFVIPNDAAGLVGGWPLRPLEATALVAIGWLAIFGGRMPFAPLAAVLMIATTAGGAAIPGSPGFRARYFATIDGTGQAERSSPFATAYTRIDRQLNFEPGRNELPVNFFNDNGRFNYFGTPRDRNVLEFSVRWSGFWRVTDQPGVIRVAAPGATGEVFIDGERATERTAITPGWHRLDVTLSSPYGAPRRFFAGTSTSQQELPFGGDGSVVTQQIRDWQMTAGVVLRMTRTVADLAALALVIAIFVMGVWHKIAALFQPASDRERRDQGIAIFTAVAAVDALRFAWPWATRVMTLVGGDDTLTYESYARDILFNGILMSGGMPPGQGEPFYYQAFYPYFLAATHFVFGEFMFGALLVQRLLAAVAIVKLVEIAIRFSAERAWLVALPIATAFVGWKFWHIAGQPLNESLYVPLLVVSTAAVIRLCDEPTGGRAIRAGVASGLATITRSTALFAWPIVWPAVWLGMRARPKRTTALAILIASFIAVLSLVATRNWIVAGIPTVTPTGGAITLLGGNEPPPGLTIAPERQALYQRFGIGDITATVIEYAITEPGMFAGNIWRKALFVLGFYEPYAPGWGYSPVYIATWIAAVAGVWLALKHRTGSIWPVLIPLLISLTQFIAIVIVYPKGERLVVPVHTLLIPYAAAAAWYATRRLLGRDGRLVETT